MSQTNAAEYFRTQADILRRHLTHDDPGVRAGALLRLRRARTDFERIPDSEVRLHVRKGHVLQTVAHEQGFGRWAELVAALGGAGGETHDVPDDGRMKRIRFSFGNSHTGPVGAVLVVLAPSAGEAVSIARESLPESSEELDHFGAHEVEYLQAYFNADAVSEADIEEWEYVDED